MRFVFICLMAIIFGHQTLFSQTYNIEYYQLKKVKLNGATSTISGDYGIFTTRVKQICYDSRSDGSDNYMGNLKFEKQSNGLSYYKGKCYLDNNCYYIFNDSKGVLNISLSNGDVYVYHKTTPSSGRTNGIYYSPGNSNGGAYVETPVSSSGAGSSSNSSSSSGSTYKKTAHPKKCTRCLGNGVCSKCSGRGTYNNMSAGYTRCPSCGGTGKCTMCHGSGTYGSVWY